MRNKFLIYSLFLVLTFILFGVIFNSFDRIKSDIYSLIALDSKQSHILESIQNKNAQTLLFLSTDLHILESMQNNPLFKSFILKQTINTSFLNTLQATTLATIHQKTYEAILNNPTHFFSTNAQNLFNPFIFRPIAEDFLNFSSYSTLLTPNHFTLNFKTQTLSTTYNNKTYYFAYALLNDDFKDTDLIAFYTTIKENATAKNTQLLIMGNAIFSAFAKDQGNQESIIMGGISLLLIAILMFLAFGSWQILQLFHIIIFSFLCGLGSAFILLDSIALFSIVISISLVGLVLDFSMHFLGYKLGKPIQQNNIYRFRRIFIIGLFIASFGYALFLFAPMHFLKEIAIISIFSLIGAFFATYFLLPTLLENKTFISNRTFNSAIQKLIVFNESLLAHKKTLAFALCIFACAIMIFLILLLPKIDFKDNIKNYSSLNPALLQEVQEFSKISKYPLQNSFIAINFSPNEDRIGKEKELIKALNLTDYQGASLFLLSKSAQDTLKNTLKTYATNQTLLNIYKNLGIPINLAIESLNALATSKTITPNDFLYLLPTNNPLSPFIFDDDTHLIYLNANQKLPNHSESILHAYNAQYFNLTESINQNFTYAKYYAIFLKIIAYCITFLIFLYLFGFIKACAMLGIILFATLISIALLLIFGVHFNIFSIFGFILAGTIGVDYILFASNANLNLKDRYFGILLASLTSIISFGMLSFSATYAVFSFGLSTALCMFFCAFFALLFATFLTKN